MAKYKRDLGKPLADTPQDKVKKQKSFGVLKSDVNKPKKAGPKMLNRPTFKENGIT